MPLGDFITGGHLQRCDVQSGAACEFQAFLAALYGLHGGSCSPLRPQTVQPVLAMT